jgi:hypothetical protein
VAIFHILPTRSQFGLKCAEFLEHWLPGLTWDPLDHAALAEWMIAGPGYGPQTFVVFREELPEGVGLNETLRSDFGAQPGDAVVEKLADGNRQWRIAA